MALDFGEIVDQETRAFWEDYDEYEASPVDPTTLDWKWLDNEYAHLSELKTFEKFFIIEGRQLSDFINKTVLKNLQPICQLDKHNTAIYVPPGKNYVICLTDNIDINISAQITELLKPLMTVSQVTIAFSFRPAYSYYTHKNFDKRCFVRTMTNESEYEELNLDFIEPIEDSNIVFGVAAGVSTWRYIQNKPFACYAVYIDCPVVDGIVASPILQLFNTLGLESDTKYTCTKVNDSNLYM